ncbi:tyrosinase family oxidase copper chaperone [Streptomyces qinzhouensis]|uniref:Tyrosinase n=1 Tax=Streptomyces qinzhouensis TaxID=2599401 RepID=A0A5B8JBL7_9ACTN|nr:tyrosinase family oxidase copper chaperone [Streptomyces qinzhouensis]QDY78756.1 tyrosinase [Streptomyces qinzhouensis]
MRFPDRLGATPTTGPGCSGPGLPRRLALRALFTAAVVGGTAGALAPLLGALRPGRPGAAPTALERFSETYRGRRIEGTATVLVPAHGGGGHPGAPPTVEVRIDGRPLHIMRRADGSFMSLVNHYESFPTLREVARAAVDELGAAQLAVHRG